MAAAPVGPGGLDGPDCQSPGRRAIAGEGGSLASRQRDGADHFIQADHGPLGPFGVVVATGGPMPNSGDFAAETLAVANVQDRARAADVRSKLALNSRRSIRF